MDWFIFAILSVLGISLANIFRRVVMKDDTTDAIASSIVFQFLGSVFVGIFAFSQGFILPPLEGYYMNYLLVGVLWALATFCQFKAYQYLEASEAIIISTLEAVVIIIASIIFLGDVFTLKMLIGTIFVLLGIVFVYKKENKMIFSRGILYALGFCLFAGLGVVNDTFMVKRVDPMSYLSIAFLLPVFFLMLFKPQSIPKIKEVLRFTNFKKIFLLTLFYAFGAITFVFALTSGANASQLGPISNSSVIVTVLLATIFLKERDHLMKKIFCAILVFIGVLLLK